MLRPTNGVEPSAIQSYLPARPRSCLSSEIPLNPPFSKGEVMKIGTKEKKSRVHQTQLYFPLFEKLIMRHIFLTGHGGPEVLIYLRDRLWPAVFGRNHCVHSNNYRARAGGFAGGVVASDLWKTELAQPQR